MDIYDENTQGEQAPRERRHPENGQRRRAEGGQRRRAAEGQRHRTDDERRRAAEGQRRREDAGQRRRTDDERRRREDAGQRRSGQSRSRMGSGQDRAIDGPRRSRDERIRQGGGQGERRRSFESGRRSAARQDGRARNADSRARAGSSDGRARNAEARPRGGSSNGRSRTSSSARRPQRQGRGGKPIYVGSPTPVLSTSIADVRNRVALNPILGIVGGLAILCVVIAIGLVTCNSVETHREEQERIAAEEAYEAQVAAHSMKLDGAEETTDDNGVVHGTSTEGVNYVIYGRGQTASSSDKITLAAVGDVFMTDMNEPILDAYAGEVGDGQYDFDPYYRATGDAIRQHDLRFINQETVCAGNENGYEYSGYPVFNTPDSSIHAIATEQFNIVNFNSNHTWDMGEFGIKRSHELFAQHPEMMVVGSYESEADRETVRMIERNGTRIAFLSYLYSDNMYGDDPSKFPNTYYSCPFDKDRMTKEIQNAQKVADAVVVYMHWGDEYTAEPNEQEKEYAQFLADLDVDLVIGSHAHIMQPFKFVTGKSGKQVPVMYGLSDFITGWTKVDTILSGMFTCDFVWHDDQLAVENFLYTPAIEWSDGGDTYVRFLKDMSDDEIANNTRTEDCENDLEYLHQFIDDLGMECPVDW